MHADFAIFFIPVLSRTSVTSMSSAVNVFAHAIRKRSKECLAQIVDNLGFPVTSPKKFSVQPRGISVRIQ